MNIKKEGTDLIKVIPSIPDEVIPTRLEYCGRFDSLLRAAIVKGCNDKDYEEEKTLNDLLREGDDLNLLNRGIVEVMD
ncbi:MAG: hypothetical protein U0Z53_14425 [Blastocatellia bacterium]